jgi:hypothetical protein
MRKNLHIIPNEKIIYFIFLYPKNPTAIIILPFIRGISRGAKYLKN